MATLESSAWRSTTTATVTTTLAKQLQRPWRSLFGCDSSIWMHKSNIYMRHGFDLGYAAASQRLTTHMWSKQCAWWGRHLNAITQREIAGKLLRSSDGDRDETRIEHSQPLCQPLLRAAPIGCSGFSES